MKGSDRLVQWFPSAEKLGLNSEAVVKNMFATGIVQVAATIRYGSTRKLLGCAVE